MLGHELARLKRELSQHEAARGIRYDPGLKRRAIAFARAQRQDGASWAHIATELGMNFETVRRWCEEGRALRRVEVVREEPKVATLSIVSASGFRLEGLTLEQAVTAMRALG